MDTVEDNQRAEKRDRVAALERNQVDQAKRPRGPKPKSQYMALNRSHTRFEKKNILNLFKSAQQCER